MTSNEGLAPDTTSDGSGERERETHILQSKDPSVFGAQGTEPINVCPVQQCTFLCGELNCVHNMIFSKHSGIFTLGNSHPLIVTLYLLGDQ